MNNDISIKHVTSYRPKVWHPKVGSQNAWCPNGYAQSAAPKRLRPIIPSCPKVWAVRHFGKFIILCCDEMSFTQIRRLSLKVHNFMRDMMEPKEQTPRHQQLNQPLHHHHHHQHNSTTICGTHQCLNNNHPCGVHHRSHSNNNVHHPPTRTRVISHSGVRCWRVHQGSHSLPGRGPVPRRTVKLSN